MHFRCNYPVRFGICTLAIESGSRWGVSRPAGGVRARRTCFRCAEVRFVRSLRGRRCGRRVATAAGRGESRATAAVARRPPALAPNLRPRASRTSLFIEYSSDSGNILRHFASLHDGGQHLAPATAAVQTVGGSSTPSIPFGFITQTC
ncbi:hypothetical protein EVAR_91509_1 [Eumeta japonica]|uniref:Uncharacterized protein n=1 Tax=Eumeta variegata TaxID=151549 RepID=A0A4C1VA59_EUMVA|nr:hypothetical protein EVAR_91509_1 [Eumeta japonica]